MIRLTLESGRHIWVNPSLIQTMLKKNEDSTTIFFAKEDCIEVKEAPLEIMKMIAGAR